MKKIYVIQAKLSPEKIKRLNDILESQQEEFTKAKSCILADYIVTELKSPSRIIKNAKRVCK
jgi:galactose-1-phosphate uridylyltransferase